MKLETKIQIWNRIELISNHARDLNREREEVIALFSQDVKEQEALRKAIRNPVPEREAFCAIYVEKTNCFYWNGVPYRSHDLKRIRRIPPEMWEGE